MNGRQNDAFSCFTGALKHLRKLNGYGADYAVYSKSDVKDPKGPETGDMHIYRGGGCGSEAKTCTPTFRSACMPEESADALGIRLVK